MAKGWLWASVARQGGRGKKTLNQGGGALVWDKRNQQDRVLVRLSLLDTTYHLSSY
jgi:hypothetical protein